MTHFLHTSTVHKTASHSFEMDYDYGLSKLDLTAFK